MPSNLLNIEQGAFEYCTKLSSITIPGSVTSMSGGMTFNYCKNLSLVISKILNPFDIGNSFGGIAANAVLKVPKGTKSEYYKYTNWVSNFKEIVEELDDYSLIINATGYGSVSYNSTTIRNTTKIYTVNEGTSHTVTFTPDSGYKIKSVKNNGADVTSGVSNNQYTVSNIQGDTTIEVEFEELPKTIDFADENVKAICVTYWDIDDDGELSEQEAMAVTDLGNVFQGNANITSFDELRYFSGITTICYNAFGGCSSLKSVSIPNSVKSIEPLAFDHCACLTSITIPSNVTSISQDAFSYCSTLSSINVDIENPKYHSSDNCNAIIDYTNTLIIGCKNTIIPNYVMTIGPTAFKGCNEMTSIIMAQLQ